MMPNRDDELGGLWLRESHAGNKFMSGKLTIGEEVIEVVVFKNSFKREGESTPDYRVYRSQPREDAPTRNAERGQSTHDASRRAGYAKREPSSSFDDPDAEIPF